MEFATDVVKRVDVVQLEQQAKLCETLYPQ
jgi:hypothetical protein